MKRTKILFVCIILGLAMLCFFGSKQRKVTPCNEFLTFIQKHAHDSGIFTQGLSIKNGMWYESSGGYGTSSLIKSGVSPKISYQFPDDVFAEGICLFHDTLYVLSWKNNQIYTFNPDTLNPGPIFPYEREGWGLTTDGECLITSDGSCRLYFLNKDAVTVKEIVVTENEKPVNNLNELEYINGYIWANIWTSNHIVVIDPKTGDVIRRLDFSDFAETHNNADYVLNGIAYNAETNRIYLTGKCWNYVYEFGFKDTEEVKR